MKVLMVSVDAEKERRKEDEERGSRSLLSLLVSAGLRRLIVRVSLHSLLGNNALVHYAKEEKMGGKERETYSSLLPLRGLRRHSLLDVLDGGRRRGLLQALSREKGGEWGEG